MSNLTPAETLKLLKQSARKALYGWGSDLEVEELTNELWIWYSGSPAIQSKLATLKRGEAIRYVKRQAVNILSANAKKTDVFQNRILYSTDAVKETLDGKSGNKYLKNVLPEAFSALEKQNLGYAAAIRSRYNDGLLPQENAPKQKLKNAVKSLTEHVNIIALTARGDSKPDLRNPVDPGVRRHNLHSDPTADIALMLMEHPELKEEFYDEPSLQEFLRGSGA